MDYNDRYFFEPELNEEYSYETPLFKNIPEPRRSHPLVHPLSHLDEKEYEPKSKDTKKKLDDEKLFLYFIIILLICAIVIITNNFNYQIYELSKKQVKVI